MNLTQDEGVANRLLTIAEASWQRTLDMRFVADVIDDSIPDAVFGRYLVLERDFVDVASRMLGAAVLNAPTRTALQGASADPNSVLVLREHFKLGGEHLVD